VRPFNLIFSLLDCLPRSLVGTIGIGSGVTGLTLVLEKVNTILGFVAGVFAAFTAIVVFVFWCIKLYRQIKNDKFIE